MNVPVTRILLNTKFLATNLVNSAGFHPDKDKALQMSWGAVFSYLGKAQYKILFFDICVNTSLLLLKYTLINIARVRQLKPRGHICTEAAN